MLTVVLHHTNGLNCLTAALNKAGGSMYVRKEGRKKGRKKGRKEERKKGRKEGRKRGYVTVL